MSSVPSSVISPRVQKVLDTPYKFDKHAAFMKEFLYKQECKQWLTPLEDTLLRIKFDQDPLGSVWKSSVDRDGKETYVEGNWEMETFG
jgi:hypothetical protein